MNSFYRGRVDPSEKLVIGRKVRDVMKEGPELGDKILLLAQSVVDAQVTIHVCCFCRKVAACFLYLNRGFVALLFRVDLCATEVLFGMLQRSLD